MLPLATLLAGLAADNARLVRQIDEQAEQTKDAIRQLQATQEQLVQKERLATVGAVVARVSREIRTPLSTIGGFARNLVTHTDERECVARYAGIIVQEVEKLETLLKEMLDFTSPAPPILGPTDVNRLIQALASVHHGALNEHHVGLRLELASDLPAALADHNQIPRVFLSLWQNAFQAMEGVVSGTPRTLTVRTWQEADRVKIAFSDTGSGIPNEVLPHIFTPFFTTKPHGTGLGLAVARKILNANHGNIEVQTRRRQGTTFVISLRIASR